MRKALALAVGVFVVATAAGAQERPPDGGGPAPVGQTEPCLTEQQRQEIKVQLYRSAAELRLQGVSPAAVGLGWPLGNATPYGDPGLHGISNFVDQNMSYPNQLLDHNCGARTYDTAAGYNHSGTDIFTWPFAWLKMDRSQVPIVAAAPGTIIGKSDGNFDRSCATAGGTWNAVYVEHADGSVAWYGHMKNGSTTPKPVGSAVAAGEYLGIVGSSGNSTGPHLHFELYDASDALIDPYDGTCNSLNDPGWWTAQRPYRDSAVNKLATHSAAPSFPACPNPEVPNLSNHFLAGSSIIFAAYYRDQMAGHVSSFSVQRPDGTDWMTWSSTAGTTYNASYWYYTRTLPASPLGRWNLRVVYQGVTYNHGFHVLPAGDLIFEDGFQIGL
jgi:murein DD-endopeptidase MepM/ murein hydrolase activator NlpD